MDGNIGIVDGDVDNRGEGTDGESCTDAVTRVARAGMLTKQKS